MITSSKFLLSMLISDVVCVVGHDLSLFCADFEHGKAKDVLSLNS